MKKRTLIAIFAAMATLVILFASCAKGNKKDEPTNPTIVGADGKVYEEVTEVHSEVVSEVVTKVVNEVVTDKNGAAVTNAKGEKETQTEIQSEVVTKVVTTVVTVTKPYVAPESTKKGETTAQTTVATTAADSTDASGSDPVEDETFPEGVLVEVPTDKDGTPSKSKLDAVMNAIKKDKQIYLNCRMVTNDKDFTGLSDVPYKLYIKGDNMMIDVAYATMKMQIISNGKDVSVVFPAAKAYYTVASTDSLPDMDGMDLLGSISADDLKYIESTNVKINGINYFCEQYSSDGNINKYYFNSSDQLKRIEVISTDGTTIIMKVTGYSTSVNDSVFTIPKGYTKLTEDSLSKIIGGMM